MSSEAEVVRRIQRSPNSVHFHDKGELITKKQGEIATAPAAGQISFTTVKDILQASGERVGIVRDPYIGFNIDYDNLTWQGRRLSTCVFYGKDTNESYHDMFWPYSPQVFLLRPAGGDDGVPEPSLRDGNR